MIIREKKAIFRECSTISYLNLYRDSVFFDIETTGLSWRRSRLYLMGALYFSGNAWNLKQWFLENPLEELSLLQSFSASLEPFSSVIHYNGQTFDLPYLKHKYEDYKLPDPLSSKESLDLYRIFRPWQKPLGLPSLKQKDAEQFLGISREDVCSGGELISCYEEYLKTASPELLELLLLHNHDDVLGLAELLPLMGFDHLRRGDAVPEQAELKKGELILSLSLNYPLPVPLSLDVPPYRLRAGKRKAVLSAETFSGEMKHFFPNWKEYYYLPLEDCAIHKSVGVYVDKNCRRKASARTCYQRTKGTFLPQPVPLFQPEFYLEYGSSPSWFSFHDAFLEDREALAAYARSILTAML